MLEIKKGNNKFYIGDSESQLIAEISYKESGDNLVTVDHTFVSDELRGQGIAKKLLDKLVQWARDEGIKIIPACSYVKVQFEKDIGYSDIVYLPE